MSSTLKKNVHRCNISLKFFPIEKERASAKGDTSHDLTRLSETQPLNKSPQASSLVFDTRFVAPNFIGFLEVLGGAMCFL